MEPGVQHVNVLQHQPAEIDHRDTNPSDLQRENSGPPDLQVQHASDIHLGDQHEEHEDSLLEDRPSKKRRRYDNDFKAEVIEHLKVPGVKLPQVAKNFGIPGTFV